MKRIKKAILALILIFSFALPLPVSAAMNGIDVSSWQTGIDTYNIDADFVICKATEGTSYVNPDCDRAYQNAKASGKKVGVYHYASGEDAVLEARFFVSQVKGYVGEAILVLDWEGSAVYKGVSYAKMFLDTVQRLTGVKPLLYTSASIVQSYNWQSVRDANYGLWIAGYPYNTVFYGYQIYDFPYNADEWSDCVAMWQYTSTGRLAGWNGNLDLNVFYGDEAAWDAYAAGSGNAAVQNPVSPSKPSQTKTYTVSSGDCLYLIGERLGVSWASIASANGLVSPYVIYPGQVLMIPGTSGSTYTVQSGDCLYDIGSKLGVSWQSIASANGIYSPYTIYPGQSLSIPGGAGSGGGAGYYTIVSGDTLWDIAIRYGTTVAQLQAWNGIVNAGLIYPGNTIRVR